MIYHFGPYYYTFFEVLAVEYLKENFSMFQEKVSIYISAKEPDRNIIKSANILTLIGF